MALEDIHRHAACGMEEQGVSTRSTEVGCQRSEGIVFHSEDVDVGIGKDGFQRGGIGTADLVSKFLGVSRSTTKNLNNLLVGIF